MFRALCVIVLLVFPLGAASAQERIDREQSKADLQQQREFFRLYQPMANRLKNVWDNEIATVVERIYPNADIELMRSFQFTMPEDPCFYEISINPDRKIFEAALHRNYLMFLNNYVQTVMFTALGIKEFSDADRVASYTNKRMNEQISGFARACLKSKERFLIANVSAEFLGEERYLELQSWGQSDAQVLEIADELAGAPVLFVMLHEFAHAYYDHKGPYSLEQEIEADAFASRIFEIEGLSSAHGSLGILALRENIAEPSRERDLSCRVARIMSGREATNAPASVLQRVPGAERNFKAYMDALKREMNEQCES